MLLDDENTPQDNLIEAIDDINLADVKFLLEQGVDPNTPDRHQQIPLLTAANYCDHPNGVEIIIQLLKYGADPLCLVKQPTTFRYDTKTETIKTAYTLLTQNIIKQGRAKEIPLNTFEFWHSEMSNIIKQGAYIHANEALSSAFQNGTLPTNINSNDALNNLKQIYQIAKETKTLSLNEKELKGLILFTITHNDYDFALVLVNENLKRLSILTDQYNYKQLPYNLLLLQNHVTENYSTKKALLLLTLFWNTLGLQKCIMREATAVKQEKAISINKELLKFLHDTNNKIQNTILAFLHPFSKSFPNNLALEIRLKIAIMQLQADIPETNLLSSRMLERLLMHRMADYEYNYHPRIMSHTLFNQLPNGLKEKFKDSLYDSLRCALPRNPKFKTYELFKSMFYNFIKDNKDSPQIGQKLRYIFLKFTMRSPSIYASPTKKSLSTMLVHSILSRDTYLLNLITKYLIDQGEAFILNNIEKYINSFSITTYAQNLQSHDYIWYASTLIFIAIQFENITLLQFAVDKNNVMINKLHLEKSIAKDNIEIFKILMEHHQQNLLKNDPITAFQNFINLDVSENILNQFNRDIASIYFKYVYKIIKIIGTKIKLSVHPFFELIELFIKKLLTKILQKNMTHVIFNIVEIIDLLNDKRLTELFTKKISNSHLYDKIQQELTFNKDYHRHLNISDKRKKIWKKLLNIKAVELTFARFIISRQHFNKQYGLINFLSKQNYKKLLYSLSHPSAELPEKLANEFNTLLKPRKLKTHSKELLQRVSLNAILTVKEQIVYSTLMHASWKLTHLVNEEKDLSSILTDNEIHSPLYRKNSSQNISRRSTSDNVDLGGYIFTTLGPEKSPIPHFLKDASGIEIDVNKLLLKNPAFFEKAIASGHWFSFEDNQTLNPIRFPDCILHTGHLHFKQHNEFISNLNFRYSNQNLFSETIYTGKRIIHFLCLIFILQIRRINGKYYQDIINHCNNIDFLSDCFSFIMNPGVLEIRYPYVMTLDKSYYRIITPEKSLILMENQIERALEDCNYLQESLKNGFNPNQKICPILSHNIPFIVNFFTLAILQRKSNLVDELIYTCQIDLLGSKDLTLSPIRAAFFVKDYSTILKLIWLGMQANHAGNARILSNIHFDDLILFIEYMGQEIASFVFHSLSTDYLNKLCTHFAKKLTTHIEENPNTLLYLEKILKVSFDINPSDESPLHFALNSNCEQAVKLFLDKNHIPKNDTQLLTKALSKKFIDLIPAIVEKDFDPLGMSAHLYILILFLAGYEHYFRRYMISNNKAKTTETDAMLSYLIDEIYINNPMVISYITSQYFYIAEEWVNTKFHTLFFNNVFDIKKYGLYEDYTCWSNFKIFFEWHKVSNKVHNELIFIRNNLPEEFLYSYILQINFTEIESNSDFKSLFDILRNEKREIYTHCLNQAMRNIQPDDIDFSYLLSNVDYVIANYPIKKQLNKVLTDKLIIVHILELTNKGILSTTCFVNWLILLIDANVFTIKIDQLQGILDYVRYYSREINSYIKSLTNINKKLIARLYILLHEIDAIFPLFNCAADDFTWANKMQFSTCEPKHYIERDSLIENMYGTSLDWSLPQRKSAVAFITCCIDDKPHVFLGKKDFLGNKNQILIAPGGFLRKEEDFFIGLHREIKEETGLDISKLLEIDKLSQVNEYLWLSGKFISKIKQFDSYIIIRHCHKYRNVDNFNQQHENRERIIYFLTINIPTELYTQLKSRDDFSHGKWIPFSDIHFNDTNGKYYYQSEELLASNCMILEEIQGKFVGKSLINETLYKEAAERHVNITNNLSATNNIISFFHKPKSKNKRDLENTMQPTDAKKQKLN